MADSATRSGPGDAMADHVTGQTTHDSALQAAPGFGLSEAGDGGESNNRSNRQRTHRVSPS